MSEIKAYLNPCYETLRTFLNNCCDVTIGEPIGADLLEERFDIGSQKDCLVP